MNNYSESDVRRVLVIDDDAASLQLTRIALQEIDPDITTLTLDDGARALRMLRQQGEYAAALRPHAIILDWNLPGMSGDEILRAVKGDDDLRSIPVVVLSTSRREADIRCAYQGYANLYVAKENNFDEFVEVLRQLVGTWRMAQKPLE